MFISFPVSQASQEAFESMFCCWLESWDAAFFKNSSSFFTSPSVTTVTL